MITQEDLIIIMELFNSNILDKVTKQNKYKNMYNSILNETNFLNDKFKRISIYHRVWHIINNIYDIPICKECKKPVNSFCLKNRNYRKFCSRKCSSSSYEFRETVRNTCIKKFGVDNPRKSKVVQNKILESSRKTCLKLYNVDHQWKSKEIRDKIKNTYLKLYGVENASQIPEVQNKIKNTLLNRYGVNNGMWIPEVRIKILKKWKEKYGTDHPMQNSDQYMKVMNKTLQYKSYTLPSGSIIKIQGYENKALDKLFKDGYIESDICIKAIDIENEIGRIYYYKLDGSKHRYFPDIYIKSENKIVEVKSNWSIKLHADVIYLKRDACIKQGLNFEFLIF